MNAISNQLSIQFNYEEIDSIFDFFILTTSDKYINGGAYTLDKPLDVFKAESVVFDNSRSVFLMFKKGIINRFELIGQIEDEKISVRDVEASELKDYILFRLFLYSLNNFNTDEIKFNNITGKFYVIHPSWIAKNKKTFKALNINVNQELYISAEAATFTHLSAFKNKKELYDYPKYEFSNKNGALKRVLDPKNDDVYVRKYLFGKRAEIAFFDFSPKNIKNNKVYFLYLTLNLLKEKFGELFEFEFNTLNISKRVEKSRDEKIDETIKLIFPFKALNLINWSNSSEYDDEFNDILSLFTIGRLGNVSSDKKVKNDAYNLIYLHNKEYYEQNKYNDPYKRKDKNKVIQHITIEDCADKLIDDNNAIYFTLLKELIIKDDIINSKKISLDDWASFNFKGDYIFGKEKDGIHYFMIVKRDGSFELYCKPNNFTVFENDLLNKCSDYLTDNKGKEKTVIANPLGDIIVISRTSAFTLPSKDIFILEKISRSKEDRDKYFSGLTDINLYNEEGKAHYNVGIKGAGMNTVIPKASILYQVDVIEGNNFIEELLSTMAVSFVKYKSFTVMPYPIKYINEYVINCEDIKNSKN